MIEGRETDYHSITIPAGVSENDLIVVVFTTDGSNTITLSNNLTEIFSKDNGSDCHLSILWCRAGDISTPTSVTTANSERSSTIVYRFSGANYTSGPTVSAGATGNSSQPNPDSFNTGASNDYYWLGCCGYDDGTDALVVYPSNCTLDREQVRVIHADGQGTAAAGNKYTGSTFDPSNFAFQSTFPPITEQWVACTVAIAPVSAVSHTYFPTDSMTITDTPKSDVDMPVSDSMNMSDSMVANLGYHRSYSDQMNITDSVKADVGANVNDNMGIADTIAADFGLNISDSLNINDSLELGVTVQIADGMSISDSIKKDVSAFLSDTMAISDSIHTSMGFIRAYADTMNITDSIAFDMGISISDALSITDSLRLGIGVHVTDGMSINDSLVKDVSAYVADTMAITDSIETAAVYFRSIADTMAITDSLALDISIPVSDIMTIIDSVSWIVGGTFVFPIKELKEVINKYHTHKIDETIVQAVKDLTKVYKSHKIDEQKSKMKLDRNSKYIAHKIDEEKVTYKKDTSSKYRSHKIDEQKSKSIKGKNGLYKAHKIDEQKSKSKKDKNKKYKTHKG